MNHSRALNNKINIIHERALRLVYRDKKSTFDELLTKDKSVKVHGAGMKLFLTMVNGFQLPN